MTALRKLSVSALVSGLCVVGFSASTMTASLAAGAGAVGARVSLPGLPIPNLVDNGGFSRPLLSSGWVPEVPPKQALPGWTVGGTGIDVVSGSWWTPPLGAPQSINLATPSGGPGTLTQMVRTTSGWSYRLEWYAAGDEDCGQSPKVMHVFWGGALVASPSMSTAGHSHSSMGWALKRQIVVASGPNSALMFADATPDKSACAAALAKVSLAADAGIYFASTTFTIAPNGKLVAQVRTPKGATLTDPSLVVRVYAAYRQPSYVPPATYVVASGTVVNGQANLALHLPRSLAGQTLVVDVVMSGPQYIPVTKQLTLKVS
ncbi:MAG TPA: hypothetical protein VK425_09085 [Acidimicrobiales bacterium]|nr:hypothetical protein [Acidimicrobiales bacterium]